MVTLRFDIVILISMNLKLPWWSGWTSNYLSILCTNSRVGIYSKWQSGNTTVHFGRHWFCIWVTQVHILFKPPTAYVWLQCSTNSTPPCSENKATGSCLPFGSVTLSWSYIGSAVGSVDRRLSFHQGSIVLICVCYKFVHSIFCSERFSFGTPIFPSHWKLTLYLFWFFSLTVLAINRACELGFIILSDYLLSFFSMTCQAQKHCISLFKYSEVVLNLRLTLCHVKLTCMLPFR